MIRLLLLCLVLVQAAWAQEVVDPADLVLNVTVESTGTTPYQQEMVLLTIHGIYRRHITLEKLEMPDLAGTNWMQLGEDHWFESTIDGVTVKNMRRRMALFPEEVGRLTIAPFVHHLTLLDESNNWFDYNVFSEPITLDVQEAPETEDWWFPVRNLEISDTWSNAPDQLGAGDGVLRIITVKAVGVGPNMMPPMPELTSPSAHIFAHPEKRLVELSSNGPISVAFWRWTIKPKNPPSAILKPIQFTYFDTQDRSLKTAKISAQRVAISTDELPAPTQAVMQEPVVLSRVRVFAVALVAFVAGSALVIGRDRRFSLDLIKVRARLITLKYRLSRACHSGDMRRMRRLSVNLDRTARPNTERQHLLDELEGQIFGARSEAFDPGGYYRRFVGTL